MLEREGKEINHRHYKLYKPYGYISQLTSNDERQQRKKKFLSDLPEIPLGIMPVGRLDEKSEGLLLLTTDGQLSDSINRGNKEKEYYVLVDGLITDQETETLEKGVWIGINGIKYLTKPCKVHVLPNPPSLPDRGKKIRDERHGPVTWLSITLTEGKFRQIRKMTSAIGCPTLRLVRIRVGNIGLDTMLPGEVVCLTNINL